MLQIMIPLNATESLTNGVDVRGQRAQRAAAVLLDALW